jgi:hypothetical protein
MVYILGAFGRIMRPSHLRNTFLALLSIFLFSCAAKKAPERLTVIAPANFSGTIAITACDAKALPERITIDGGGHGTTSICSASPDLKIVVIRGGQSVELPATIGKTGDNYVVSIRAEFKPSAAAQQ